MKITRSPFRSIQGNTLVLTIVVTGLIGFLLASYMGLVKSQNIATMRSQSWNATIPVIEAGIEDALTHVNLRLTNDLVGDGWERQGSLYVTKRFVGQNYYTVTIAGWVIGSSTNRPIVESRGYVVAPITVASVNGPMFAATLTPPVQSPSARKYVIRGIRCTTRTDALFSKGLVAKGTIDLKGHNILSDSYDSRSTNSSTNGRYDETKRNSNGSVATNSGLTNSVNIGNAKIYGKISTGPGGSISIGPQGAVGEETFVDAPSNNGKIQQDYFADDMNVDFGDVRLPQSLLTAFPPLPGVVGGTNYAYVLGSGGFKLQPNLTLGGGSPGTSTMIVTGRAALFVAGPIDMQGQAKIVIAPGGSLTMYVAGPTANIGGGGIVNQNAEALTFQYYGLANNTSLNITGNGTFVGTVYAPNADLTLNGGGAGVEDFSGAIIAKTVTMNGSFEFHYDEALMFIGPPKGYIVTTWNEMPPAQVALGPSL